MLADASFPRSPACSARRRSMRGTARAEEMASLNRRLDQFPYIY
jgi:hypothetical protein